MACKSFVYLQRDSSNESGATDAVGLSMNMSEMDDTEMRGKKKRGRPGKQAVVSATRIGSFSLCACKPSSSALLYFPHVLIDVAVGQQEAPQGAHR